MTTITRPALLSAVAYMLQAAGVTVAELARHMSQEPPSVSKRPSKLKGTTLPPSNAAMRVLALADRPEGATVAEVMVALCVREPTAHHHVKRLADDRKLLTRVQIPGERAHRFFARPAHAEAYLAQRQPAAVEPAGTEAPRVALSEAEQKAIRVKLAKQAGARNAPPPMGARTQRRAPGRPGAELVVRGGTASPPAPKPQPAAEPIVTEATVRTIDSTKRPSSRIEAAPALPADPRWPSFSSAPLGVNPDTGRPWA